MFTRIGAQHATHSSGFSVAVKNREALMYQDDEILAVVTADLSCLRVPIYTYALVVTNLDGSPLATEISKVKRAGIIQRIIDGMEFLGIDYEVVATPPVIPEPKIYKRSELKDPRFDK
jgi:hypothetical protein